MIKAEVEVNEDNINCNGFNIKINVHEDYSLFFTIDGDYYSYLDEAIVYCLEKKDE